LIDFFQTRKIEPKTNLKFTLSSRAKRSLKRMERLGIFYKLEPRPAQAMNGTPCRFYLLEPFEQNKGFLDVFSKVNGLKISINFSQNHSDQEECLF